MEITDKTKFCRDCKWLERTKILKRIPKSPRCFHPSSFLKTDQNDYLVTGYKNKDSYEYAYRVRNCYLHMANKLCGESGRFWEPR